MNDFIKIASLVGEEEAQRLESMLTEQGIPHAIAPASEGGAWGCVSAAPAHQKAIMFILSGLRQDASRAAKKTQPSTEQDEQAE
jgi:hypothetical protein